MNLARLRELTAAGQAGTIRPEELKELFEVLPSVLSEYDAMASAALRAQKRPTVRSVPRSDCVHDILLILQRTVLVEGLTQNELFRRVKGNRGRFRRSLQMAIDAGNVEKRVDGYRHLYRALYAVRA